ncbi:PA0069 family radical SAM protein [Marinomonas mediterranea]|uniref:PA0069 family radical SAM protein n=1 Tax=Marinomonas mediterranea TaxID=119864 RepID=UPI00234A710A|nr:PA0069 family radical SAM protein [Marinomonas mediterranea]WCN10945.1 PA0069 family radical SAM protein [Marinomonas mediterranea]
MSSDVKTFIKGRGTSDNILGRFEKTQSHLEDEYAYEATYEAQIHTEVRYERAKSLITSNTSPDVPFRLSVNPYRGCEHGCIYCFARPSHAYIDLSPGLDFETKLTAKINAPNVFERELCNIRYQCQPIALGINTDAYQPIEKQLNITRSLLEIAYQYKQPISLITKSALITRDLSLLEKMAAENLVQVAISITTLDNDLKRILEPRTASGHTRLNLVKALSERRIPTTVLAAPVIPFVNDHELESIVHQSAEAGAQSAHYIMLRLPHEVAPLFTDWLHTHLPDRAEHVLSRIKDMRGGQLYDSQFGKRMTGEGIYADLIRQRFHLAIKKTGLSGERMLPLDCSLFRIPPKSGDQLSLI